jgi:hypothetical protein
MPTSPPQKLDLEGTMSSLDISVQVDESVNVSDNQKQPLYKSASKHLEMSRRLFQRPLLRRPTQISQQNMSGIADTSHAFILENDEENPPMDTKGDFYHN